MKLMNSLIVLLALTLTLNYPAIASEASKITADEALQKLKVGNEHYLNFKLKHPDQSVKKRMELTKGQVPFAIILSCSDSRVPPEVVFDQGLGDLFVIRVAGNVIDDNIIGSIEYAVEHLGTPLVVVVGHEKCGAVSAAVNGVEQVCHIQSLVKAIQPAVNQAKKEKGDLIDNSIRTNVKLVAASLKKSEPILAEFVHSGKVKVVEAYYHLDTGKVDFVDSVKH